MCEGHCLTIRFLTWGWAEIGLLVSLYVRFGVFPGISRHRLLLEKPSSCLNGSLGPVQEMEFFLQSHGICARVCDW